MPPSHTFLLESSQKMTLTSPEGPLLPRAWKADEEKEATLFADVPLIDENDPATKMVSPSAHPAFIFSPASVEPSAAHERRVEVDGSKETVEELKRSRPANVPASPTCPMRSKLTFERAACAGRAAC